MSHIDLHWTTSEHCIDGQKGDLEMQLNHFDLSFDDYEEASETPGATIALALIFQVSISNIESVQKSLDCKSCKKIYIFT